MHKSLIGLAAAAGIGLASLAAPAPANAGCWGCGVGFGVLGGVAAGAIIGSAIANSPPPGYYPPPPDIIRRPARILSAAAGRLWPAARPRLCAARARLLLGAAPGLGRRRWLSDADDPGLSVTGLSVSRSSPDRTTAQNYSGRLATAGRFVFWL